MAKSFEEIAKIAANWWADKLKSNFSNDNGDFMQSALRDLIANKIKKPTDGQIELFNKSLIELLTAEISKLSDSNPLIYIIVDYQPCGILHKAFDAAGMEGNDSKYFLPCKTEMMIGLRKILVKEGYGAPFNFIYNEMTNFDKLEELLETWEAYVHASGVSPSSKHIAEQREELGEQVLVNIKELCDENERLKAEIKQLKGVE